MKPRAGNIDSICSKLGQHYLKVLLKIPCEHKCHTKYGWGPRSSHERSPETFFFGHAAHDVLIYSHFCTYSSKIEAILQSDSMRVNDSEGRERPRKPGSHKVSFLNWSFRIEKNLRFWTSLISGFQKCPSLFWENVFFFKNNFWTKKARDQISAASCSSRRDASKYIHIDL